MDGNVKSSEYDAGYGAFVIWDTAFSTTPKINEAIGNIFGVLVSWGKLLT